MARSVHALLQMNDGFKGTISGVFEDDEWCTLERFVDAESQLAATRLRQSRASVSYEVRGNFETGELSAQTVVPDDDEIGAFLHRLRPFVLNDEPTNFGRVCNLLTRRIVDERFRQVIAGRKAVYFSKRFRAMVTITSTTEAGSAEINSEETLQNWLNGFEYHRDKDKRDAIDRLHWLLPVESSKPIFLSMLLEKADAIGHVAHWIRVLRASVNS